MESIDISRLSVMKIMLEFPMHSTFGEVEREAKDNNQGYSQHLIAKVLELNQATVQRIIKRTIGDSSNTITNPSTPVQPNLLGYFILRLYNQFTEKDIDKKHSIKS